MQALPAADGTREILALRALKLGDLLVAVPALHALRSGYPEHRLILATTPWLEPIVDLIGGIDALVPTPHGLDDPLPVEPGRIELAINVHGNGILSRDRLRELEPEHTLEFRVPTLDPDATSDDLRPLWRDGELERARWARLVNTLGLEADPEDVAIVVPEVLPHLASAAVVHVGAFYGSRKWPEERFAAVALFLARQGHRVVYTGGAKEADRAHRVAELAGVGEVLAGVLDLREFAAVVAAAETVVTVDTGAAHLASAYRIPSVVLFGSAPPEEWGPPVSGPHVVLTDPSLRRGDAFSDQPDPALLAVQVEDVLEALISLPSRADVQLRRTAAAQSSRQE
ncbi:glycosyltransferase family 9 protein [Rathayibacter toxicus]|uniref:glycosyltransferase family 9 protein n=1 Tax=Rathayibacter toxicus TaxID=145458 RepID=UPI000CE85DB7|nr:glycosyltransferase family 9 protein [Rathayibacter toxicus]PPI55693.1 glycosyl transferase [Rathayibacter toxicus]QOD09814.1 glycosyltransferase family 9 protein [Rathayibacter toxicus]QWL28478.1 glycosyltransferase family 9 protein [Rathayibacter toxicus]QWL32669.1 glycosyltransferase family 9 protein [Rathayibacter toxicus]QWL34764.1 glycosyltransferase family 9 protein [Rathayibacter toxicus]